MSNVIFQGATAVTIEGHNPLQVVTQASDHTIYEPAGFEHAVTVVDYRPNGTPLNALANLTIMMTDTAVLQLCLHPPTQTTWSHTLWLATGSQATAPPAHPLFLQIAPVNADSYTYLALCPTQ